MSNSRIVGIGVGFGIIALALVASFAIFLPKASGHTGAVDLPDTLVDGWVALDLEANLASLTAQGQDPKAQAASFAAQTAYADEQLAGVGLTASSRFYGTTALDKTALVQVVEVGSNAFIPDSSYLIDPATAAANGSPGTQLVSVPGGTCVEAVYDESAQAASTTNFAQCQVSRHGLTAKVTGQATKDEILALADAALALG